MRLHLDATSNQELPYELNFVNAGGITLILKNNTFWVHKLGCYTNHFYIENLHTECLLSCLYLAFKPSKYVSQQYIEGGKSIAEVLHFIS